MNEIAEIFFPDVNITRYEGLKQIDTTKVSNDNQTSGTTKT